MSKTSKRTLKTTLWNAFQRSLDAYRKRGARVTALRAKLRQQDEALARERELLEERFGVRLEDGDRAPSVAPIAATAGNAAAIPRTSPSKTRKGRTRYLNRRVRDALGLYARVLRAVDQLASRTDSVILPRAIRAYLRSRGEYPTTKDPNVLFRALSTLVALRYLVRRPVLGTRRGEYRVTARGRRVLALIVPRAKPRRRPDNHSNTSLKDGDRIL